HSPDPESGWPAAGPAAPDVVADVLESALGRDCRRRFLHNGSVDVARPGHLRKRWVYLAHCGSRYTIAPRNSVSRHFRSFKPSVGTEYMSWAQTAISASLPTSIDPIRSSRNI